MNRKIITLVIGDLVVFGLVTAYGFAMHAELDSAGARMLTTFAPLCLSWFMIAPFLGCYDLRNATDWRQLWRPFYGMVLAGPLAGWLRAILLGNAPIMPIFVLVLGGISALAILIWRFLIWLVYLRKQ